MHWLMVHRLHTSLSQMWRSRGRESIGRVCTYKVPKFSHTWYSSAFHLTGIYPY